MQVRIIYLISRYDADPVLVDSEQFRPEAYSQQVDAMARLAELIRNRPRESWQFEAIELREPPAPFK